MSSSCIQVVPARLVSQWNHEIRVHGPDGWQIEEFHGTPPAEKVDSMLLRFSTADVVSAVHVHTKLGLT